MRYFSSKRLTVARQRRAITRKALAEALNVTPAMVTGYEAGTKHPSPETARAIATVLRFSESFFLSEDLSEVDPDAVSFRSRRSLPALLRDKTVASLSIASELISPEFHSLFEFPEIQVPNLAGESPERAANILRNEWKLGQAPVSNMLHLLESKGVEVYFLEDPSPCLDAVSLWWDRKPYVMMNLGKSGDRGRFDAAHELGHLVLHKNEDCLDRREVERDADRFASAFLLPAEQFRRECPVVPSPRLFFDLKERWGVAIQAMIRRGRDLGLYTEWQYESACKEISVLGWRKSEPVSVERERSRLHELAFNELAKAGYSAQDFAARTQLSLEDLMELVPAVVLLGTNRSRVTSILDIKTYQADNVPSGPTQLRLIDCG